MPRPCAAANAPPSSKTELIQHLLPCCSTLVPQLELSGWVFSVADTIMAAVTSGRQVGDSSIFNRCRCLLHCP